MDGEYSSHLHGLNNVLGCSMPTVAKLCQTCIGASSGKHMEENMEVERAT